MTRELGIGPVPEGIDEPLRDFLTQARNMLLAGSKTGAFTGRFRGSGSGLSGVTAAAVAPGAPGAGYVYDPTPPPTPTGVTVGAGIDFVGITTDPPTFSQGNGYGRTIVYGAKYDLVAGGPLPTFSNATIVHEFVGQVGTFPTEPATQWHIWVKWRTRDGIESVSPQGGANGNQVTTGQDVSQLLTALSGAITRNEIDADVWRTNTFAIAPPAGSPLPEVLPFIVQTTPTTLNGATIPAGVYMDSAFIRDLTAVVARMGNAWITNAMISSLAATKITAGSIAVGEYIQSSDYESGSSGWRLGGNMAEFGFANIRGVLQAGQIGVGFITAASAIIADAAISTAKIQDLAVGTIKIADNAITFPVSATLGTDITRSTIGETTILTAPTFDPLGGRLEILASVDCEASGFPLLDVLINGSIVATISGALSATGSPGSAQYGQKVLSYVSPTGLTGNQTVTIQIRVFDIAAGNPSGSMTAYGGSGRLTNLSVKAVKK